MEKYILLQLEKRFEILKRCLELSNQGNLVPKLEKDFETMKKGELTHELVDKFTNTIKTYPEEILKKANCTINLEGGKLC